MSPLVSVALFRRNGQIVFKSPRKEASHELTQARKSASRFWNGNIQEPDVLTRIILVRSGSRMVHISELTPGRPWIEFCTSHEQAMGLAHVAACLTEIGVSSEQLPPPMPDVIEINGMIYRREI